MLILLDLCQFTQDVDFADDEFENLVVFFDVGNLFYSDDFTSSSIPRLINKTICSAANFFKNFVLIGDVSPYARQVQVLFGGNGRL